MMNYGISYRNKKEYVHYRYNFITVKHPVPNILVLMCEISVKCVSVLSNVINNTLYYRVRDIKYREK